jgi:hypothetical protein
VTVTVHLPPEVEQAFLAAARSRGVPVDQLVADLLISNPPAAGPAQRPELIEEQGVPVLRAGAPLDPSVVNAALETVRRERDSSAMGLL